MILQDHYKVKIKKNVKIQYLHYVLNESFIMLCTFGGKDAVLHVDKTGKELFYHKFEHPMDTIGTITEKQVLFLETRVNKLTLLDLQTHLFSSFPFQFMYQESDQSNIISFSQSKLICIEQKGRYNQNRYKLTYYQYPFQIFDNRPKTLAVYQSKNNQWTYQHTSHRANAVSMIIWYKPRHEDCFDFKTYQLVSGKGQHRLYKFTKSIAEQPNVVKTQVLIYSAWELKKNKFIFLCYADKEGTKKTGQSYNDNYIINLDNQGAITHAPFTFGPYQDSLIDCMTFGSYAMFRTYGLDGQKQSPTYYLDNERQTMVCDELWECSHLHKYQFEGYTPGLICEGIYDNDQVCNFEAKVKKLVDQKGVIGFLLSEGCGEIEEQLVEEVVNLLI